MTPIDVLAKRRNTTRGALYKTLHDARRKLRTRLADDGLALTPGARSNRLLTRRARRCLISPTEQRNSAMRTQSKGRHPKSGCLLDPAPWHGVVPDFVGRLLARR